MGVLINRRHTNDSIFYSKLKLGSSGESGTCNKSFFKAAFQRVSKNEFEMTERVKHWLS